MIFALTVFFGVSVAQPTTLEKSLASNGLIELELASRHRLRITAGYDPDAVARRVRHLT